MTAKGVKVTIAISIILFLASLGAGLYLILSLPFYLELAVVLLFPLSAGCLIFAIIVFVQGKKRKVLLPPKEFLDKVHNSFNLLNYRVKLEDFDYEKFTKTANNTICHTEDLADGITAIKAFGFVDTNLQKIFNVAAKKYEYWNTLKFNRANSLKLVDDNEAQGSFYFTNAVTTKYKEVYVFSYNFNGEYYKFTHDNGRFYVTDESTPYFLRYSKTVSSKMVLEDKNYKKILVVGLSDNLELSFTENKTNYECIDFKNQAIGIFKKSDVIGKNADTVDMSKCIAIIDWDIVENGDLRGASRFEIYNDPLNEDDYDLLFLIASSTFLIYQNMISTQRMAMTGVAVNSTLIRPHRF